MNLVPTMIDRTIAKRPAAMTFSISASCGDVPPLPGVDEQARQGRREPRCLAASGRLRTRHRAAQRPPEAMGSLRQGAPVLDLRGRERFGHPFEPDAAGRFHEYDVSRPHDLVEQGDSVLHRYRMALFRSPRAEVAAGQLADGDYHVGVLGRGDADETVVRPRVRA